MLASCALSLAARPEQGGTLREAFADDFLIGVALNGRTIEQAESSAARLAAREFAALTAENDMKWQHIHPAPGRYNFAAADAYLAFAEAHGMEVIGHTLVWHSQTPDWVFTDAKGNELTREELLERMREHIQTVVGRYRGRIKGWDVVNEAIDDDKSGLRDTPWRRIIGDDYLDYAFRFAREADPAAELYYNDYSLVEPGKRARTLTMLRGLIERGIPVDGVGMQGHYHLHWPKLEEVDRSIRDFASLGLKVMITELDVDVLPSRNRPGMADIAHREEGGAAFNPYTQGLPDEVQQQLADRYAELFAVFLQHRQSITRVTLWGLGDGESWLNNFPIPGRTNYPLLFDRALHPKPAYELVRQAGQETLPAVGATELKVEPVN
ncbi:MAG: endo-1,4-beta-xylanase [Verrucomicrobiota bacterium JB022]|nr:endo-1,4-beta-xylanase [Verrucomicrobiota bacterium JB022]